MMRPHPHPSIFMFLIIPFGVISGYISVAIGYRLAHVGIPVAEIAGLVAAGLLPHTWKFLWAPIADTTLTRKGWYLLASLVSAAGIFLIGALPATRAGLPLLAVVVVAANVAVTFLGMSVESLLAYCSPENEKGRAGGWLQAGNLGGSGLGGGAGLWLQQHLASTWLPGAIVAGACLACCLALTFLDEPHSPHRHPSWIRSMSNVARDLWGVARSRLGFLALVLCFLPIGSGAASGLWAAVASDWHASVNTVALATGVASGVLSAFGCLVGGWICDRMNRKAAYAAYGILQALCAVAMALAPRTEWAYIVFTSLYAIIMGLTYAGFSAFALEAMGLGAAATKYNVFASLSNMPIYYMTNIDGWAHTRWGPGGMLLTEAAFGAIGLLVFVGVVAVTPRAVAAREAPPTAA